MSSSGGFIGCNMRTGSRVGHLWLLGFVATVFAALAATVLFRFDPNQYPFYPRCYFHELTGLECPGCGSLRALHQLLHGNFMAALRYNAILVLSLPVLAIAGARAALAWLRREPVAWSLRPAWLWSALVVMVGFGIVRNLPWGHLHLAFQH